MPLTAHERSRSRSNVFRGMDVLLVEDDCAILRVLSKILEKFGASVTQAVSGDAALDILNKRVAFDVIVTDEQMPGETQGHDLIEYIKETLPSTPIILMSGYAIGTKYEITDTEGSVVIIMKPLRSDELLQILTDVLRLP